VAGDTSNRGLGSDKMSAAKKRAIQSAGGQASHGGGNSSRASGTRGGTSARGAAGHTEAAKRGGEH